MLGRLLTTLLQPPEITEARTSLTMAADAGQVKAQLHLGILLAIMLDPPERAETLMCWKRAAEAGDSEALQLLGDFGTASTRARKGLELQQLCHGRRLALALRAPTKSTLLVRLPDLAPCRDAENNRN